MPAHQGLPPTRKLRNPVAMTPPRKMTAERLERAAYHYLQRFSASRAHFRRILETKIRRANPGAAALRPEERAWIAAIEEKCVRLGLIDDRRYAEMKARTLLRRGQPPARVARWLSARGVAGTDIELALAALAEEAGGRRASDCAAALNYARRRRFGPFRGGAADKDRRRREIAAMMRAGFSYGLAKRVVETADAAAFAVEEDLPLALPDDADG